MMLVIPVLIFPIILNVFVGVSVVAVFITHFDDPIDLKNTKQCIMQYLLIYNQLHDGELGIHAV